MKLLLALLLAYTAAASVAKYDALNSCSDNSDIFSSKKSISGLVDQIKSQLIQNPQAKQSLVANSAEFEQVKQKLLKCTEELMKRNQFKVLENLIEDILDPLDLDFSNEMRLVGTQIKKDIDSLVTLAHSKKHTQTVAPAFQWIQSRSNLFLQIKFAHRHDAPGCLEVKNEKIEFTEDGFYFSAFGIQGQQPIQFVLKLPLYKEIVPEQSSWNLESVGRLFVNITKVTPEVWVSLLKNNEKLPQMRFWWEMQDNYQEEMKEYDKLLEELEEQEAEAKRPSRGRKQRKTEDNVAAPAPEPEPEVIPEEKSKDQPANVDQIVI